MKHSRTCTRNRCSRFCSRCPLNSIQKNCRLNFGRLKMSTTQASRWRRTSTAHTSEGMKKKSKRKRKENYTWTPAGTEIAKHDAQKHAKTNSMMAHSMIAKTHSQRHTRWWHRTMYTPSLFLVLSPPRRTHTYMHAYMHTYTHTYTSRPEHSSSLSLFFCHTFSLFRSFAL